MRSAPAAVDGDYQLPLTELRSFLAGRPSRALAGQYAGPEYRPLLCRRWPFFACAGAVTGL